MNKIEIIQLLDTTLLSEFVSNVEFLKFNLYPNSGNQNIRDYLNEQIGNSIKNDLVIASIQGTEIIALASLRELTWDSNHFGFKCMTIENVFYNSNKPTDLIKDALALVVERIISIAISKKTNFISVSIGSEDSIASHVIQSNHFEYILTWVDGIYDSQDIIPVFNNEVDVGLLQESELDYYANIAKNHYFKGGRFYLDKNFETALVDKMYSNLVYSSFSNNDIMLSYRIDGKPFGLFVCKKITEINAFNKLKVAPLRFLVIDPKIRKKNVGYELFSNTINYLINKSDIISTGLEINNLASLNLHRKLNFKFNYTHNVFHWWAK